MRPLIILLAASALTGCATPAGSPIDAPMSASFGKAVASMQSQIIPIAQVSELPPESSGQRGAAALKRYQEGKVKALEAQSTSSLTVNMVPAGAK